MQQRTPDVALAVEPGFGPRPGRGWASTGRQPLLTVVLSGHLGAVECGRIDYRIARMVSPDGAVQTLRNACEGSGLDSGPQPLIRLERWLVPKALRCLRKLPG